MSFTIRVKSDPDKGTDNGLSEYDRTVEVLKRIVDPAFADAGIGGTYHELAFSTFQRAAFDAARELGCELAIEDIPGGTQFTFDFVGSIVITEVAPDPNHLDVYDADRDAELEQEAKLEREDALTDAEICDGIRDMIEVWDSLTDAEQEEAQRRALVLNYAQEEEQAEYFDGADAALRTPDETPPRLDAVNQGGGLWGLTLNGVVVLQDESYTVVHGIIDNSDVGELQEIRDSLVGAVKPAETDATATQIVDDNFEALRIGRAIAFLLQLEADPDELDAGRVRFDTAPGYGNKTYEGLARFVARLFDDPQFRQELVVFDSIADDPEELEEEFTDGLEDYRGGALLG